ncbi:hypothetical protein [Bradyrhizobium sp. HKCCYLR20261]|uniref:hypothetical protein n=1 Tax=Bradyrhizobium sp. HKCCYLR20261 TaxID=3420760 RepID=UPI003EC14FDF
MSDDTERQPLPQPPGGGSWIRQADGSLVPNLPVPDDAEPAPKAGKSDKKGK